MVNDLNLSNDKRVLLKTRFFRFNFQNSQEKRILQVETLTMTYFKENFVRILELVSTSYRQYETFMLGPTHIGAPRNLWREGWNVKFRAQRGWNFEKMVFSSPKKSNCEVSLRKWWIFGNLGIKFRMMQQNFQLFHP